MGPKRAGHVLSGGMLLLVVSCLPAPEPVRPFSAFNLPETEMVQPEGYPLICKWMLDPDLLPAHWMGGLVQGKALIEPINLVIIDGLSRNPEDARINLERALVQAGFPIRYGHSSGYFAYVGGRLYSQLPASPHKAYSDNPFELPNDHGRVFGPVLMSGHFVFVAGFSREGIAPLDKVKHRYLSFNRARDRVAERLDQRTAFKRKGFADLRNHLTADPTHTTGDHDGRAAVLELF